jgi:site-specific recombinase XerD
MASVLYGSGLRITVCLQLRVQDVDFQYQQLTIRNAKGDKDRLSRYASDAAARSCPP